MLVLDAEARPDSLECVRNQLWWDLAQAGATVAAFTSTGEERVVDIGCDDRHSRIGAGATHSEIPKEPDRIGLLAGCAAGRPATCWTPFEPSAFGNGRQYAGPQAVEDATVPEKARHRDVAKSVEGLPFLWVTLQPFAIRCESIHPERGDASSHSLADLMPHLSEARPIHVRAAARPIAEMPCNQHHA